MRPNISKVVTTVLLLPVILMAGGTAPVVAQGVPASPAPAQGVSAKPTTAPRAPWLSTGVGLGSSRGRLRVGPAIARFSRGRASQPRRRTRRRTKTAPPRSGWTGYAPGAAWSGYRPGTARPGRRPRRDQSPGQ